MADPPSRMDTVVARVAHPTSASDNLAAPRHRCRICSGDHVSARRHRLRSGIGRAGRYAGFTLPIAPLLAYALLGPSRILVLGPRLIAGCCHSGRSLSFVWRRTHSRRGAGRNDGIGVGDRLRSCRRRAGLAL